MIELFTDGLIFAFLVGGLGLPIVAGIQMHADERLCLGAVAGCTVLYLCAWLIYWFSLPVSSFLAIPCLSAMAIAARWASLKALFHDHTAASLAGQWSIVAAWCLGLLALIRNYSGGEWVGDWLEHYHRSLFFLQHQSLDTRFLHLYLLPARPPLANLAIGAFMAITQQSFVHYQIFATLLATLAFLPTALLARRFTQGSAASSAALLTLLVMLSPMFVQNATFAWTKLPAAFFVLAGLHFALSDNQQIAPDGWSAAAVLCLAAALLTHYSAAPYLLMLVLIWVFQRRIRKTFARSLRRSLPAAAGGLALLSTWVGWSLWHFGRATYSATSVITDGVGVSFIGQFTRRLVNLFNLVVPHPLRQADYDYIVQANTLGALRDFFFNLYQTNLWFIFGCGSLVLLLTQVYQQRRHIMSFWGVFIVGVVILSAAVVSWPDRWGAAHIGLQPLVLLGLAWVAATAQQLRPPPAGWLIAGLVVDATFGIGLQFALQHVDLSEPFANYSDPALIPVYGYTTWRNFFAKSAYHLVFLGDHGISTALLCAALGLLLVFSAQRAWRRSASGNLKAHHVSRQG